jgi:hypothetical protein
VKLPGHRPTLPDKVISFHIRIFGGLASGHF